MGAGVLGSMGIIQLDNQTQHEEILMELELTDIRKAWDTVRLGLEHVRRKASPEWLPEDIYAACVTGQAFLYSADCGFIVVQPQTNKITSEPELLVWVAYSNMPDSVSTFQGAVDNVARDNGFKRLVMWSNRPGWEKVPGWVPKNVIYEREL